MLGNDFIKRFALKKPTAGGFCLHFPKGHVVAISLLGVSLLLFSAITPSNESTLSERKQKPIALALAETNRSNLGEEAATPAPQTLWKTKQVKAGDSLSVLFQQVGLPDTSLFELMNSHPATKQLTRLQPGQTFHFQIADKQLLSLTYEKDSLNRTEFVRTDAGFVEKNTLLKPDTFIAYREATIAHSLFAAGTEAGMEESLIMELANIFGWDIDFALDIRSNDRFKILYEEKFLNGEKLGNGSILAAEFINQGVSYRAVRYTDSNGNSGYFTPDGKSMRKAFLRTPVDFTRISSHFNLKRKHPILKTVRAHKGTDYAAPRGTPIRAAGDGKVIWAGTKGGYGRTVIIQHGQTYKTLYAHMYKYGRGIRAGKRVKQGQTIGYVGSSGLSTGPHLHYEFHVNGAVRNPVRVKLPKAKSIPKAEMPEFTLQTQPIVAQLQAYGQRLQVALANKESADDTRNHKSRRSQ